MHHSARVGAVDLPANLDEHSQGQHAASVPLVARLVQQVVSAVPVGTVIAERFEVVHVIGQGGNGAVCEVLDRSTGRRAALKMLVGENAELAGRLEREAKALEMLGHPHIVAFVDAGRSPDGTPYVVTELIEGVSLRTILDTDAMAPRRALAIIEQVLEALDHVHAKGIIHRDIKPDNIMLVEREPGRDFIKLIDFGIAKVIDPNSGVLGLEKLTRAGFEVLGSPPYIAPETAIGEPIDARTDLYGVGIVLFEMLAGRVPFHHADRTTLLRQHVTDPVPPLYVASPDGTPAPELEAIVVRALAKVADQRFPSAMAMHAAVEQLAQTSESQIATAPSHRSRARQLAGRFVRAMIVMSRQHPARFAALATACVVAVLAIAIAIRPSSSGAVEHAPAAAAAPAIAKPPPPASWIAQAEAEVARRRYGRAIAAYDRALAADHSLVRDGKLRIAVAQIASDGDAVSGVIALELLATHLDPPDKNTIVALASTGRVLEVRQRAFAIAERDGYAKAIDRFASWTLDLKQQSTCEDRRETITKLRDLGDPRVVEVLQRAKTQYTCVAKDAAAAIAQLQSSK